MNETHRFKLSGIAVPADARHMLGEICDHFVEHAEVNRDGDHALLTTKFGTANLAVEDSRLLIELACISDQALQMSRTSLAEHMFYFAGEEPLELNWSEPASPATLPNLHEATVVSAEDVTPHMRRVKFACADISPFIGGDMHVRLLVPPQDRPPVWPGYRADGRIAWPEGDDALLVRVYTIRHVDETRREVWIDFLQHPAPGIATPGADFARDAHPGQRVGLLGPGGGSLPKTDSLLMIGDESALPAIARIVAEMPATARIQAIIEVEDEAEEQPLAAQGRLELRWLHRKGYAPEARGVIAEEARKSIAGAEPDTFIWAACEKDDIRAIRSFLKERKHDKKNMYVAWYWERTEG